MKPDEAWLERSATLPKYDIVIKPRLSEIAGKVSPAGRLIESGVTRHPLCRISLI